MVDALGKRIRYSPRAQRIGRSFERLGKRILRSLLGFILPLPENLPIPASRDVRQVLLVRPTFRIGNTLIASPLVLALRERFPNARVDFLSGDTTATLLANLPLGAVHCISRRFIVRPWQFLGLVRRLRQVRYDVSVETGNSLSGGIYAFLIGARYRIGAAGAGDRFLNVRLPHVFPAHVYDRPVAFARLLGADCPDHPVYEISAAEHDQAARLLRDVGLGDETELRPFVGLFVGGHQAKRWPMANWLAVARALAEAGGRVIVFLGPEELAFADSIRSQLVGRGYLIPPQPLRLFAALWSMAGLVVTPDSGPMHLAAALGRPTITLVQTRRSLRYAPRTSDDIVLLQPSVEDVLAVVKAHRRWTSLADTQPDRH
jgi:lipopolysaccharide heptosyltransferase III